MPCHGTSELTVEARLPGFKFQLRHQKLCYGASPYFSFLVCKLGNNNSIYFKGAMRFGKGIDECLVPGKGPKCMFNLMNVVRKVPVASTGKHLCVTGVRWANCGSGFLRTFFWRSECICSLAGLKSVSGIRCGMQVAVILAVEVYKLYILC